MTEKQHTNNNIHVCFLSMFSLQKRQDRHFGFFSALYYNNACIVFCATSAVLRQMVKVVSKAGRFLTIVCPSWLVFKECLHGHNLHRKPLFWDITVLFFILKSFFFSSCFTLVFIQCRKKIQTVRLFLETDGWSLRKSAFIALCSYRPGGLSRILKCYLFYIYSLS